MRLFVSRYSHFIRSKMHVYDPKLSVAKNCQLADDLSHAAWLYAGEDHREEYRNCGVDAQRSAWLDHIRLQMLKDAILEGELLAFGIADHDFEIEFQRIPSAIFSASDLRLNCECMTVQAIGRTFREVKVCLASPADLKAVTGGVVTAPKPDAFTAPKAGRKDTYNLSVRVLRRLFEDGTNRGLSAERLHPAFEKAFAEVHPMVPPPSVRTLRKQLQRFRQEPETIGKN
jgi:hypothetical protein